MQLAPSSLAKGHVDPLAMRLAHYGHSLYDHVARELRRRENARTFRTNLGSDSPFASLNNRTLDYIVFYGGREARKSWAIAEHLIRRSNKERRRVLCTREYQNSIKDSVHTVLKDMIGRLGLDHRFDVNDRSIRNPYTGAEFIFKGLHHNVDEIKSTEGIDDCWVAEAQNTEDESWEILLPTIRKAGAQVIVDFNVTDEDAPTYRRFVRNPPPNCASTKVNFDSNPYLAPRSRAAIEWLKKQDYDSYLHVYEGMPKKFSEAIIFGGRWRVEGFADDLWEDAIREGGRLHYGLDHGFARDPYALVRSFVYQKKLYIEHEAFGVGVEFAGNMAEPLVPGGERRGELEQLLDTVPASRAWPIKADNSRPETISFLRGKGFLVDAAEKWKGSVEDGLAYLKGFEEIIIHSRCRHMQEEARMYSYKRDRITREVLPIVVDAYNHGWDAVRYSFDGYIQRAGDLNIWAKLGENLEALH